ncbi:DUF3310 domain-containing protein [Staphylococcus aureus]|uniref:DUF3310 domain-containing protein n=1 Tax=Staphylococcus aureus TaxID=1280 RepID=UPI002E16CB71|nr:DUF3310 domain-containing protein [Staphylococcus aureus]
MAEWKCIKGDESDFEGAPDWATMLVCVHDLGNDTEIYLECEEIGAKFKQKCNGHHGDIDCFPVNRTIIAQRERVTSVNDDNINHPLRYTKGDVECIDAIKAATIGKTGIEAVCVANVVKYLWRYEDKNGVEDVKKARWYLERLIKEMGE